MLNTKLIIFIQILLLAIFSIVLCNIVGREIYIDGVVNNYFQNNYSESWKGFFEIIAEIWDKWGVMILGVLFSIYFYIKKYFAKLVTLLTSMTLWVASSILIKYLIARERPENMIIEYGEYSFPSGHSVFAVLFYGLLVYLFWNIIKNEYIKYIVLLGAIIMWILVMLSRVYLSVHYASDVFAWAILWLFWLLFGIILYRKIKK